jgi:hypothetical protein
MYTELLRSEASESDFEMKNQPLEIKSADNFGSSLPLVQAEVRTWFVDPLTIDFISALHIGQIVRNLFPNAVKFEHEKFSAPGKYDPSLCPPGELSQVAFMNDELFLLIYRNMIIIRWMSLKEPAEKTYPGFPVLFGLLSDVIARLDTIFTKAVQPKCSFMAYKNFITFNGKDSPSWFSKYDNLVDIEDFQSLSQDMVVRSSASQVDLKIISNIATDESGRRGVLYDAEAAKLTNDDDWKTNLIIAHDELNRFFKIYISEEAKREWSPQ